jgi:hypothetical protein
LYLCNVNENDAEKQLMQRGLSLTDLARKIEANRELKADYIAPARSLKIEVQSDKTVALMAPTIGSFPILSIAHDQIGAKTGIPGRYYDRMLTTEPELLASNINTWLGRDEDQRMLRTLGGDLRAFLSDRYNRVENEEIAGVVLPVLLETQGIQVVAAEVTDRRLYMLATTDRVQGEVRKGDVVQAGVLISNSEVGQGALSVRPMVYRLACLNGLVLPDGRLTARHVGRRISNEENLNTVFSDEALKADDRALLLKVRDVVRHSLNEAVFTASLDKMRGLAQGQTTADPVRSIELLAKKVGATDDESTSILAALVKGGDLSAYGLLNAVTYQAHATKSFDRAVEFEQMGGTLLEMPKSEWRQILEAA